MSLAGEGERMTRTYGQWAGDPKGRPEDIRCCIETVMSGFHSYQCQRKRGFGPDGLYCKQHDPDAIKQRKEESDRKYQAAQKAAIQKFNDQLVGARLRESNPDLYATLLASKKVKPMTDSEVKQLQLTAADAKSQNERLVAEVHRLREQLKAVEERRDDWQQVAANNRERLEQAEALLHRIEHFSEPATAGLVESYFAAVEPKQP